MTEEANDRYKDSMLTTLDNPYNPFTNYDEWNSFDEANGYYTAAYLDRIITTSDNLSDEDESLAMSYAISQILELNITGNYVAVTEQDFRDRSTSME